MRPGSFTVQADTTLDLQCKSVVLAKQLKLINGNLVVRNGTVTLSGETTHRDDHKVVIRAGATVKRPKSFEAADGAQHVFQVQPGGSLQYVD